MNATSGSAKRLLGLAIVLFGAAAHASDPSPADIATARDLYKLGAEALEKGDAKGASEKLSQAWALVQTPVIGVDLARAQTALGHFVEAREAALAVERLTVARSETATSTQARRDAERIADQLAPRIAHIKLALKGVSDADDVTVKLDNDVVPRAVLAVERSANPGAHTATVDVKDGRHAEASVTLTEGETRELVVEVAPAAVHPTEVKPIETKPVETTPPILRAPQEHHTSARGISPVTWIGVATGGVGLAVGAIAGAFAWNDSSTVKANCTTQSTTDNKLVCGPNDVGTLSEANTFATISTIGFIVAGVGVGVMVVGLVIGGATSDGAAHARVVPMLGPVSGIAGVF